MKVNNILNIINVIILTFISPSLLAASNGVLELKGVIPLINQISVETQPLAQNIDIPNGTEGTIAVATEISNNRDGYNIQIYSYNGGQLVHQLNSSYKVSYQLSYANGSFFVPGTSSNPTQVKNISVLNELTTSTSNINIKTIPNNNTVSGNYNDTIVITITAN
ncbi:MAG: hypothetical protein HQK49_07740 [Oligoflexia bacterium]|nr:hypothetical protein [Oligoflexia bacterium]